MGLIQAEFHRPEIDVFRGAMRFDTSALTGKFEVLQESIMFITFEGIDGAGKSTHIKGVVELLSKNRTVVVTREPGGTETGELLRRLVLSKPMDLETELLLMTAARRQHLAEVIEPALAAGHVVVCDRFHDSTFAFQGGGRGLPRHRIQELDRWLGGKRPDLTFYFDIPVDVAMARIKDTRQLDRFEQEQTDFHQRVRDEYLSLQACEPQRIVTIDADQGIDAIFNDIKQTLTARGLI